jgi:hypothetical protein
MIFFLMGLLAIVLGLAALYGIGCLVCFIVFRSGPQGEIIIPIGFGIVAAFFGSAVGYLIYAIGETIYYQIVGAH